MTKHCEHANHLHQKVEASYRALGKDWPEYKRLAKDLPLLLRENGLQQTLCWLNHQAGPVIVSERDGKGRQASARVQDARVKRPGAARLLQDWLGSGSGSRVSVAAVLAGKTLYARAPQKNWNAQTAAVEKIAAVYATAQELGLHQPHYALATWLALAEAHHISRSAEIVDVAEPSDVQGPPPAPQQSIAFEIDLTKLDSARRNPFRNYACDQHMGLLWRLGGVPALFDSSESAQTYKSKHVGAVVAQSDKWAASKHCAQYKRALNRWQAWARPICETATVKLNTRLFIGLGGASVHETQVLLHPVWGLPYLPGSTLKGALKAWLRSKIVAMPQEDQIHAESLEKLMVNLFGTANDNDGQAGLLTVHDAWWLPDGTQGPLVREVETPHHMAYYAGQQDTPTAFDSPNPVAQLAVQGSFWLAIAHHGATQTWADQCMQWLCLALGDNERGGLGGKAFAAGYGLFTRV
jgi:CRISPR type III-B/RAMP module RAMP protein Cmr6